MGSTAVDCLQCGFLLKIRKRVGAREMSRLEEKSFTAISTSSRANFFPFAFARIQLLSDAKRTGRLQAVQMGG